jgi:hypothetical protein
LKNEIRKELKTQIEDQEEEFIKDLKDPEERKNNLRDKELNRVKGQEDESEKDDSQVDEQNDSDDEGLKDVPGF